MKLESHRYRNDEAAAWDAFIDRSINGTFLHSRRFFDHNPLNSEDDHSLVFLKKQRIVAVFPAALYERNSRFIYHSHPRATYGGFVVSDDTGVEESLEMVETVIAYAKELNAAEIIVRNPFRIFNKRPADETDYAMWYHGFSILSREMESAVLLDEDPRARYQNGARYNIKKALKTVEVRECELFSGFWEMLEENLRQKHNSVPTHSLEQFLHLRSLVGADKIKLFGGFIEGRLVAGVVLFNFYPTAMHAQYIASDPNYQDVRPINAVIDVLIDWGRENGFTYFNLGTANEQQGKKFNLGLFHFKEGFGARSVLRETMSLSLK